MLLFMWLRWCSMHVMGCDFYGFEVPYLTSRGGYGSFWRCSLEVLLGKCGKSGSDIKVSLEPCRLVLTSCRCNDIVSFVCNTFLMVVLEVIYCSGNQISDQLLL